MGLGVVRRDSLAQAGESMRAGRNGAERARAELRQALDPIDERDRRRGEARAVETEQKQFEVRKARTLARVAHAYHEHDVEPRLSDKHGANWIRSLEHHVPSRIWHSPIDEITPPLLLQGLSEVRSVDDKDVTIPETLRRVRQRLEAVFEDAIFHGYCTTNPARAIRRKMRERLPARNVRSLPTLPYQQLPAFMKRVREAQGTAARALEFAILTASRTSEVLFMRNVEVDLAAAVWVVPAARMKAKEAHSVYLSEAALEIVRKQQKLKHELVFPSSVPNKYAMSNMAMLAVLGRLDVRYQATVHGLCRASFSTWAYDTAAARPEVIEACLAHQEVDRVKAAYNRAEFANERRALIAAWAQYLGSGAD